MAGRANAAAPRPAAVLFKKRLRFTTLGSAMETSLSQKSRRSIPTKRRGPSSPKVKPAQEGGRDRGGSDHRRTEGDPGEEARRGLAAARSQDGYWNRLWSHPRANGAELTVPLGERGGKLIVPLGGTRGGSRANAQALFGFELKRSPTGFRPANPDFRSW